MTMIHMMVMLVAHMMMMMMRVSIVLIWRGQVPVQDPDPRQCCWRIF